MEIRRVNRNTYDVFLGTQWSDWSRVRKGRSSTFVVAGAKMARDVLKDLHEVLWPGLPVNYGQTLPQTIQQLHAIRG